MAVSESAGVITSVNPAHPDRVVGTVPVLPWASAADLLDASAAAQGAWAASAATRARCLESWADAIDADRAVLADLVVREVGKPVQEAHAEVERAIRIIRYYAQTAFDAIGEILPGASPDSRLEVMRRPLGVVVLITPWNFPLAIPAWKLAPALASGNAVVFRPSSASAVVAAHLAELARRTLPADVFQHMQLASADIDALLRHRRVNGVSFTGSEPVGRTVIATAAQRGIPVQAEMGGQNPSLVLDDASVDEAAFTIAGAAMAYAGQKCTATSRVVVHERVAEKFIGAFVDKVSQLAVGDPVGEEITVGPVISEDAQRQVKEAVTAAMDRGGRLLVGGDVPRDEGWYWSPTVVQLDDPFDPFAQEETFGPAASVHVAASDEEAVEVANASKYGLSAAVFTSDMDRGRRVAGQLAAGMVRVNASTTGVDYHAPFGGERASSYGPREQGRGARDFFTRTRTIMING